MPTKIPWAQETINPIKTVINDELRGYHCTKVSEGCLHCYGERMNLNAGFYPWANGLPYDDRKYEYALDGDVLARVRRWRKPRRVFVQSMSDLFHEDVPEALILFVLKELARRPKHVFIFLTKRPKRMKEMMAKAFPLGLPRHFWLLVTAENQPRADERLPVLLSIPAAAVRGVSIEPCLGPVKLHREYPLQSWLRPDPRLGRFRCVPNSGYAMLNGLDWVILGPETGPGRRAMLSRWTRDVKDQCVAAGTAFFLKQMYRNDGTIWQLPELDGRVWNEYPEGLVENEAV